MPFYHKLGRFPSKRHTTFEKETGGYYYEQLFGTEGFSGFSSLLYHVHRPTQIKSISNPIDLTPVAAVGKNIQSHMIRGYEVAPQDDFLDSRVIVLFNNDLNIACASPRKSLTTYFYKNADADEVIFIHKGTGKLRTLVGNIPFEYGDYLVIPRGMIYQIDFDTEDNRLFIIESFSPVFTPRNYRNKFGQLLEHSPFCERDFKIPSELETRDEKGDFVVKVKKENILHEITYATHPFDVVGWDGFNYPYAFSIHNFEPITGRVHMPPPIHQTFEGHNFVICSFKSLIWVCKSLLLAFIIFSLRFKHIFPFVCLSKLALLIGFLQ